MHRVRGRIFSNTSTIKPLVRRHRLALAGVPQGFVHECITLLFFAAALVLKRHRPE
jgi:hypothetical protein